MNIRTLVPRLEGKYVKYPLTPTFQSRKQAIKGRLDERIFLDTSSLIQRTRSLQQQSGKVNQLNSLQKDIFHPIVTNKSIQVATQSIKEIIKMMKMSIRILVNNYKYLQIIILCQSLFQSQRLSQFPKDTRWICTQFSKLKTFPLESITQIITINMEEKNASSLFRLKHQNRYGFSVFSLSEKRNLNLSESFDMKIYKLDETVQREYFQKLTVNNEYEILSVHMLRMRVYQTIVKGLKEEKPVVVIASEERQKFLEGMVTNNFLDVKVKTLGQFNLKQDSNHFIIFVEVEKPPFIKLSLDYVVLKVSKYEQPESRLNESWTTFNSDISMSPDIDTSIQISPPKIDLQPPANLSLFNMKLKTMDFILGGSFIRFFLNLQQTFIPQDFLIMHSNNKHPQIDKSYSRSNQQNKNTELFRPNKDKSIKLIAFIHDKFSESIFNKLMSCVTKESCNTISFRECEDLDCFQLLGYVMECSLFSNVMNHHTVVFEFTDEKRFQRFVVNYFMGNNK